MARLLIIKIISVDLKLILVIELYLVEEDLGSQVKGFHGMIVSLVSLTPKKIELKSKDRAIPHD